MDKIPQTQVDFNEFNEQLNISKAGLKKSKVGLSDETWDRIENGTALPLLADEPQVLFLGTASMKPTAYRGASGVMFTNKKGALLMDSAEGSYGQLWDHLGGNKHRVDEVIRALRVVFITHIHGDH